MLRKVRLGLTLIEVVVILFIVVILLGLLMPALSVTNSEARRRAQCHHSLMNIAIATSNFEGAKKCYPGFQNYFGQSKTTIPEAKIRINGEKLVATTGDPEAARPSSNHPGIVIACMMDGSVKHISENIDYQVYQALMTPQNVHSDMPNINYHLSEREAFE